MKRFAGLLVAFVALMSQAAVANAAVLDVDPQRLAFGRQAFDTFATKTITITNTGSTAVLVGIEDVEMPDDFSPGQPGSTCPLFEPTSLQPGESCTHTVGFSPSRVFAGRETAVMRITARDPESRSIVFARLVKISGRGVEADRQLLTIAPERIDFGTRPVGSENLAGVTVKNRSGSDLRVLASAGLPDDFGFGLLPGSTCPALDPGGMLAAGESCDAIVRFSPTEFFAGLVQTGTLVITATHPATGELLETHAVPITGRGSL